MIYNIMDRDGDCKCKAEEIVKAFENITDEEISPDEAVQILKRVDLDNNGFIDF